MATEPANHFPSSPPRADPLPLSALNDLLYCQRRAALKFIDGLRGTNEHTILGDLAHEHVDSSGYEQRAGWTLLRALPLFSDTLGLTGKADLVEVLYADNHSAHPAVPARRSKSHPSSQTVVQIRPVEYKKGPKRRWDNDEVQLCAQALCLEEMFGLTIDSGAIFHASSQTRREITFDPPLRRTTLSAIDALKALIAEARIPPAELKPQCDGCSLHELCLPEAAQRRRTDLFTPRNYA